MSGCIRAPQTTMSDIFTEASSQSIFGRLGDSIKGVLFGIVLIPLSIILLFWNEGNAVKTAKSLKEGSSAVISATPDAVTPANEGKLIHLSGEATTTETVIDPRFAVSQPAIRLSRKVEMFQWQEEKKDETHKKLGGGKETTTTYTYSRKWSDQLIRSSDFKQPADHQNPAAMVATSLVSAAKQVTLGKFQLPPSIVRQMHGDQPVALTEADLATLPADLKAKAKLSSNAFYLGADPAAPAIGDHRITFTVLKPAPFSILARQSGQSLDAYPTAAGRTIERVESGNIPATAMFQHAASENATFTWILRIVGTALMAMGIGLILSPLATLADVVPLLGDLMGAGTFIAALLLGTIGSATVIAVAWFAARPVLSVVLVAAAIGVFVLGKRMAGKKQLARA